MNPALTTLLVGHLLSANAEEDERPSAWTDRLKVEAGVDAYYGYNFNRPGDASSFPSGLGTSAKRANEFGLNLATLGARLGPDPVGFNVLLGVGSSMEVLHAAEPRGTAVGLEPFRFLQQASLVVAATDRLTFEAGVYPSHIGFESFQTQRNWNYTRGYMGELSPYYQTGIMAALQFSEAWSGMLHLLNGWQVIGDFNAEPAVGTQVAWTRDRARIAFNTYIGREPAGDEEQLRLFGDVVGSWQATDSLQLAASVDAALQLQGAGVTPAHWWAVGVHGRYALTPRLAVAVRGEVFDDADGVISGTAQTLAEVTGTVEFTPMDALVLKLEGRHDHSTADVFSDEPADTTPAFTARQTLVLLGGTVYFD
ncbi:MAG: outer membrane beta-barrel protein [Myxococcaceae bacterium]